MPRLRFEPALPAHARVVAETMRERDKAEVIAGWGDPHAAILNALWHSPRYARTCFYGLEPLAIYGLSGLTILGDSAQVWCFGTTAIDRHPIVFARASRLALATLYRHASVLTNVVDATDAAAMRWLNFLGATYVLDPRPRGGRLFGQFILARANKGQCQQG
jgi:hypothetical protein